jgi:hypothetical protein
MRSPAVASTPAPAYTLKKKIAAIYLAGDTGSRLGLFTELPEGAQIDVCGCGFSETTIKVRCHGQLYFVFRQDLDL